MRKTSVHSGTGTVRLRPPCWDIERRRLLQAMGGILGIALTGDGWAMAIEPQSEKSRFFSEDRYLLLDAAAETIIPRTDTGGARDADVAARFDSLMASWASLATQSRFGRILDEIEASAQASQGKKFVDLDPAQQLSVMEAFDRARSADRNFLRFKQLIFSLYYMSELGATQELRYDAVPGVWKAAVKVTPDTRAWAWEFEATGN